jgi:hypothetical protein
MALGYIDWQSFGMRAGRKTLFSLREGFSHWVYFAKVFIEASGQGVFVLSRLQARELASGQRIGFRPKSFVLSRLSAGLRACRKAVLQLRGTEASKGGESVRIPLLCYPYTTVYSVREHPEVRMFGHVTN